MRKYPTDTAYVIGVRAGKLVIVPISKYANNMGTKYPTREEAEAEIKRRNETNKNT